MAVPLLDKGEMGFNTGEDVVLDRFRLQLPLIPSTMQAIPNHITLLLNGRPLPLNPLLPLVDHLREGLSLLLSLLVRDAHRLNRLNDGLVSLVLVVDLNLCHLDQLLKLGHLDSRSWIVSIPLIPWRWTFRSRSDCHSLR